MKFLVIIFTFFLNVNLFLINCQPSFQTTLSPNIFTPIYGYNISVKEETGILIKSLKVKLKYDCFSQCLYLSECAMIMLSFDLCKLYNQVKYSVILNSKQEPTLFEKYFPDTSINSYLIHHWPFNNNLFDIVSSANLYGGPSYGKSFVKDRLNREYGALYLNNSFYLIPPGVYFSGDFTFSSWIRMRSVKNYGMLFSLSTPDMIDRVCISLSLLNTNKAYVWTYFNGLATYNTSSIAWTIDKWQHFASTLEGNSLTIYVDGKIVCQASKIQSPKNIERSKYNYLGAYFGSYFPDVEIDDIKIFKKSLTQAEIYQVLNSFY